MIIITTGYCMYYVPVGVPLSSQVPPVYTGVVHVETEIVIPDPAHVPQPASHAVII